MSHIKLLLILVFTTASSFAFCQWTEYNTHPEKITQFSFVDDNIGYALNSPNNTIDAIHKTSDGGNTWTTLQSPFVPGSTNISCIEFIADGVGFITFNGTNGNGPMSTVYKTIDDGATWDNITPIGTVGGWGIGASDHLTPQFITTDIGYISSWNTGVFYRTTNGGASWDTTNLSGVHVDSLSIFGLQSRILSMDFFDENNGIINLTNVGAFNLAGVNLLTTIDGGVTWEEVTIADSNTWYASQKIVQASPSTAYASNSSTNSTNQIIFKITNNGLSVDTISLPNSLELQTFDFIDELNGFIVLKNHNTNVIYIESTNDGGANWTLNESISSQIFGATININDLHLTNTSGYLSLSTYTNVGPGPMWLESFYKFEGNVGISEIETTSLSLYPNPAAAGQTIRLNSNRSINQASIFDLNGALISKRSIHNNSMELPSLNPGMYIILLSDGETTESTRLIIK